MDTNGYTRAALTALALALLVPISPWARAADAGRWPDFLPIWGSAARAAGYELPRPIGLAVGHMAQKQPFTVDSLTLEGSGVSYNLDNTVVVSGLTNTDRTTNVRLDAWLLPFLNVYAVVTRTSGRAEGTAIAGPVPGLLPNGGVFPFDLHYNGKGYGGGVTLAGGWRNFFGVIDSNYVTTNLDISSVNARSIVTSVRLGYRGSIGPVKGSVWIGGMYEDIAQTFQIPVAGVGFGHILPGGRAVVAESPKTPLNTIVGARWEVTPGFDLMAEYGFGPRDSIYTTVTFRF